jgi:organic radical activating enzyme
MIDPKKKYNLFRQNKNFCVVPWTNFELYTNGDVRTCSVGGTRLGNINKTSIHDILAGDKLTNIRKNMLDNKADKNCTWCVHRTIEDDNFSYLRDHYNSRLIDEDIDYLDTNNFDLRFIDLHWSNICNLRCVMCWPQQSSLIAKDQKVITASVDKKNINTIIDMIKQNQKNLKEIYLSGGEPFYIPYNTLLLDQLENTNIPLRINTNMHWKKNNKLFKILTKKFKNVQLTMSVDALGDKFDYIRNGANWNRFISNLQYVRDNTDFEIRINSIFSVMNAIDIDKVVNFFYHDQKIKDITINILHRPTPIDAKNYPTEKKADIIQKLENCLETLSREDINLINNIKNCIMQIKLPKQEDYIETLNNITKRHKTNWQEMFTDLI